MQHRNMDVPAGYHSIATVHSILERGTSGDVIALLAALRRQPHSTLADDALAACEQSEVYGYPALIKICLSAWRNQNVAQHTMG
jgi:hypothetical protein